MRLNLSLSKNSSIIPFDHLPKLAGVIHKWLGNHNVEHGATSLYSFSWLQGSRKVEGGLDFPKGAGFFISVFDERLLKKIIKNSYELPQLFNGMEVEEMQIQNNPTFNKREECFMVASPVLVKLRDGKNIKHCLFDDKDSSDALTNTLKTKMRIAGIDSSEVRVKFDLSYSSAHTKLVNYNGIKNKSNVCPVIVKGTPEQIAFAWNVGAGNSTGIGFGALN